MAETTTPVRGKFDHHIEEVATVYLRLSDDGSTWEVDSPSNDGSPLEGYPDGALHEECPCMYEDDPNEDAIGEGNSLARDWEHLPNLPTLPELYALIGEYLGHTTKEI